MTRGSSDSRIGATNSAPRRDGRLVQDLLLVVVQVGVILRRPADELVPLRRGPNRTTIFAFRRAVVVGEVLVVVRLLLPSGPGPGPGPEVGVSRSGVIPVRQLCRSAISDDLFFVVDVVFVVVVVSVG